MGMSGVWGYIIQLPAIEMRISAFPHSHDIYTEKYLNLTLHRLKVEILQPVDRVKDFDIDEDSDSHG
jgi:hypothetical protein